MGCPQAHGVFTLTRGIHLDKGDSHRQGFAMQTRPRPSAPPLWQGWCRCLLGLSASDAADWWEALSRAASGPAATLRHVVLYHSTRKLRFAELMSFHLLSG